MRRRWSSTPRTATSGPSAWPIPALSSWRPATRGASTAFRPAATDSSSTTPRRRTCWRWRSTGAGNLLAGTGTPGQVIRIDTDGSGFAVLDSPYAEIRALRPAADGSVYAVAVGASPARTQPAPAAPQPAPAPVARVTTSTTVTAVGGATATPAPAPARPAPQPPAPGPARGAVYRIHPDGAWDAVWESQEDTPYDVALDDRGRLIIGTGNAGKIYRVADDPPRVALLARAPAEQITSLLEAADGSRYYATSNPRRGVAAVRRAGRHGHLHLGGA